MATTNVSNGFNVTSHQPIDSRIVFAGRPWTNPNVIAVPGNSAANLAYVGLLAVDTTDDSIWTLTDLTNAAVDIGWTMLAAGSSSDPAVVTTLSEVDATENRIFYLSFQRLSGTQHQIVLDVVDNASDPNDDDVIRSMFVAFGDTDLTTLPPIGGPTPNGYTRVFTTLVDTRVTYPTSYEPTVIYPAGTTLNLVRVTDSSTASLTLTAPATDATGDPVTSFLTPDNSTFDYFRGPAGQLRITGETTTTLSGHIDLEGGANIALNFNSADNTITINYDGAPPADGEDGTTWFVNNDPLLVPGVGLLVLGDLVDSVNGDFILKTSAPDLGNLLRVGNRRLAMDGFTPIADYTLITNLRGATGPPGMDGAGGSVVQDAFFSVTSNAGVIHEYIDLNADAYLITESLATESATAAADWSTTYRTTRVTGQGLELVLTIGNPAAFDETTLTDTRSFTRLTSGYKILKGISLPSNDATTLIPGFNVVIRYNGEIRPAGDTRTNETELDFDIISAWPGVANTRESEAVNRELNTIPLYIPEIPLTTEVTPTAETAFFVQQQFGSSFIVDAEGEYELNPNLLLAGFPLNAKMSVFFGIRGTDVASTYTGNADSFVGETYTTNSIDYYYWPLLRRVGTSFTPTGGNLGVFSTEIDLNSDTNIFLNLIG